MYSNSTQAFRRSTLKGNSLLEGLTLAFRRCTLTDPLLSEDQLWQDPCSQKVHADKNSSFHKFFSDRTLAFRRSTLKGTLLSVGLLCCQDPCFQKVYSEIIPAFRKSTLTEPFLSESLHWHNPSFQKVYSDRTLAFSWSTLKDPLLSGLLWKNPFFQKVHFDTIGGFRRTERTFRFRNGCCCQKVYSERTLSSNWNSLRGPLKKTRLFRRSTLT